MLPRLLLLVLVPVVATLCGAFTLTPPPPRLLPPPHRLQQQQHARTCRVSRSVVLSCLSAVQSVSRSTDTGVLTSNRIESNRIGRRAFPHTRRSHLGFPQMCRPRAPSVAAARGAGRAVGRPPAIIGPEGRRGPARAAEEGAERGMQGQSTRGGLQCLSMSYLSRMHYSDPSHLDPNPLLNTSNPVRARRHDGAGPGGVPEGAGSQGEEGPHTGRDGGGGSGAGPGKREQAGAPSQFLPESGWVRACVWLAACSRGSIARPAGGGAQSNRITWDGGGPDKYTLSTPPLPSTSRHTAPHRRRSSPSSRRRHPPGSAAVAAAAAAVEAGTARCSGASTAWTLGRGARALAAGRARWWTPCASPRRCRRRPRRCG
jgi:hypothetical protein